MCQLKRKFVNNKGFTLVELIVVLVILAILAAFTIPAMLGFVEDARGKAAIAEAREVYVAAQSAATQEASAGSADSALWLTKIPQLLEGDITVTQKDIEIGYGQAPVLKGKRIGIEMGNLDTNEVATVKSIQYVDQAKKYMITIKPGEAAQVEKYKGL